MTPSRDPRLGADLEGALPSPVPARGAKARVRIALKNDPHGLHGRGTPAWLLGFVLAGVAVCAAFYAGQRLRTPPVPASQDSVMSLGFARVLLRPGAQVDVERDDDAHAIVRLVSGAALFHVQKGTGRAFEVIAGGTHVEVVGTVFAVSFAPPSDVRVQVADGVVQVREPSGNHRLVAGGSFPAGSVLLDDARELSALRAPVKEIRRVPVATATGDTPSITGAEALARVRPADAGVAVFTPEVPEAPERRSRAEETNPYTVAKRLELGGDRDAALAAYERLSREQSPLAEDALFAVVRMHSERGRHTAALAAATEYRRRFAVGRYSRDVDVRSLDAHLVLGDAAAARREADAFLARYRDDPRAFRFHLARAGLFARAGDCAAALAELSLVPAGQAKDHLTETCANR